MSVNRIFNWLLFTLIAISMLAACPKGEGALQITEFCASVDRAFNGGTGPEFDWIEIYNSGDEAVTLEHYALTDDKESLLKWRFPPHHYLLPKMHALVMASGQDIPPAETEWHANFSLKSEGEFLALVDVKSKKILQSFDPYPPQKFNVSYDGKHYHLMPTPGKANANSERYRLASNPRINPASGAFTKPMAVTLTCDKGDAIYYSTDGSVPTIHPDNQYVGPIPITTSTLVRAIASAEDAVPSLIQSKAFVSLDSELQGFSSNLPILVVERFGKGEIGPYFEQAHLLVFEPGKDGRSRLTERPDVTTNLGIHLRGQSSRQFEKLPYRLETRDDSGDDLKISLLGMPKESDWILHNPYLDKSLIRNAFSYAMARDMGLDAVETRPCEVFVNQGGPITMADYQGVYQLMERIERGKKRIDIAKLAPDQNAEPDISGGYIVSWDVGRGNYLDNWKDIQVRYPAEPSTSQMAWLDRYFTAFDQSLRDPSRSYAAYMDVDSWVNGILFQELIFDLDSYVRSFYMVKDRGQGIRFGPVWDHNLSMGIQFHIPQRFDRWYFSQRSASHGWVRRLYADPVFRKRMAKRWRLLREALLSNDQLIERLETHAAPLREAAGRNFEKYDILAIATPAFNYPTPVTVDYEGQLQFLRKWLIERAQWMDQTLNP